MRSVAGAEMDRSAFAYSAKASMSRPPAVLFVPSRSTAEPSPLWAETVHSDPVRGAGVDGASLMRTVS
jgi:hypothetical protein